MLSRTVSGTMSAVANLPIGLMRTDSWLATVDEKADGTSEIVHKRTPMGRQRNIDRWRLVKMSVEERNDVLKDLSDIEYNYLVRDGINNPLRDILLK